MKRKLIIGSLLAIFILSMLPTIPAVEYNTAVEINRSNLLEKIESMGIEDEESREKIASVLFPIFPILSGIILALCVKLLLSMLKLIRLGITIAIIIGIVSFILRVIAREEGSFHSF